MDKLKSIYASAHSTTITIVVVTVVTVGAELYPPFKNWLAGLTGHHWVTKSFLSLATFALFYGVVRVTRKSVTGAQTRKALFALQTVTIAGFLIILGFYMYEFFVH